jgi:hypothetical protein
VTSLVFAEEQGSYMVGVAAAKATKSDKVGFIGGVDTDLIKKFQAGYVLPHVLRHAEIAARGGHERVAAGDEIGNVDVSAGGKARILDQESGAGIGAAGAHFKCGSEALREARGRQCSTRAE